MFNTHNDRGRVLLTVRVHSVGWTLFLSVVLIVWVCLVVLAFVIPPGRKLSLLLLSLLFSYLARVHNYIFYPRIRFQEGGVEIPVNRESNRVRFMRWDQIRRWSWEGDLLILSGSRLRGGTVRIPGTKRLAVDQLMGTKLAVR